LVQQVQQVIKVLKGKGYYWLQVTTGNQGTQGRQGTIGTATINNNAANRVITGDASAGVLNAQANFTYNILLVLLYVKLAWAFKTPALASPVITLLAALLFIVAVPIVPCLP
jgi:hypothetical protein